MNTAFIIFGASGDLTARKLIPAMYNNYRKKRLPETVQIIGFSRSPYTDDSFREKMKEAVAAFIPEQFDIKIWDEFARHVHYQVGDIDNINDYRSLVHRMSLLEDHPSNMLFYLATAPGLYSKVIGRLHEASMTVESDQSGFRRIVVEKPFGNDLASAIAINNELHGVLDERQIYRIDHYLGKETVQNVLVLRFGNAIFEPLWNRNYIDHIQITVAESVGVEHRAGYFDQTGTLRDMFQNHLLQLLMLVAKEPPVAFEADALHNEKVKVLRAIREIPAEYSSRYSVRGQYDGYCSAEGVRQNSATETYAAIQVYIDNWRWQGVPFYLRSGKNLKEKSSEITIQFRRPPTQIFDVASGKTELFTNRLSICIQPDEGIHLRFAAKVPDLGLQTRPVDMDFHYRDSFGSNLPEAYERLLLDALLGDKSLFARSDVIEHSWKIIDSIRSGWESEYAPPLFRYQPGSWGPEAANTLIGREGRWWIQDCRGEGQSDRS
ncbi:MAG: glucose-6-phosphate dehydrogenase [Ignavibacteriae bacterium]|nr:MAG: glucose-6-phosphate dehydrogenase [Ignavibacteriota bacterium]